MAASNVAFYAALFFSGVLLMSGIVLCSTRPVPSSQAVATLVGGKAPSQPKPKAEAKTETGSPLLSFC
jgi:hypothetical protein